MFLGSNNNACTTNSLNYIILFVSCLNTVFKLNKSVNIATSVYFIENTIQKINISEHI